MRGLLLVAGLVSLSLARRGLEARDYDSSFSVAKPGGVEDIIITDKNTLNGTYHDDVTIVTHAKEARNSGRVKSKTLQLRFLNTNDQKDINAYVQGLDPENKVVFVGRDGKLVWPSSGGSHVPKEIKEDIAIPLKPGKNRVTEIILPISMTSGRIYFSEGHLNFYMVKTPIGDGLVQPSIANNRDPSAGIKWGFVEMTYTKQGELYANISFVDFVGMILSIGLSKSGGGKEMKTLGLPAGSIGKICKGLMSQKVKDGYPWDRLCVANAEGKLVRILSPNMISVMEPKRFAGYWEPYVEKVWKKYQQKDLTINTQMESGKVKCRVRDGKLKCDGDDSTFTKPNSGDIWGCNDGPFRVEQSHKRVHVAAIPRLCAAFSRSTLLLEGGNVQPGLSSEHYYLDKTSHHYSRLVHEHQLDGRGYAFPYDDVNPSHSTDASGLLSTQDAESFTVYVGGVTE